MRVVATVTGSLSHARPMSAVVPHLLSAGHEVRILAAPSVAGELHPLTALGATVSPVLPDPLAMLQDAARAAEVDDPDRPGSGDTVTGAVAGPFVFDAATTVVSAVTEFGADLVLRDDTEFGALLAAEHLDLPHVALCGALSNMLVPTEGIGHLNRHWRRLGHSRQLPPEAFYRHGRIDMVPAEFDFARVDTGTVHRFRQPLWEKPGDRLPAAFVRPDGPLVYVSFGTVAAMMSSRTAVPMLHDPAAALDAVIDAAGQLGHPTVVATSGHPVDRALPANVVVSPERLAQTLVLEVADVFVTHAGYNGIRETLRAGVPVVAIPFFGDQVHLAARAAELGLGVAPSEVTVDSVRDALATVLTGSRHRDRARLARRQMLALPPVDRTVALLEGIAAR